VWWMRAREEGGKVSFLSRGSLSSSLTTATILSFRFLASLELHQIK